ncbi:MAG: tRNA (5-methylaminomethyl-2-thiouridine)(34)-methyltransferase MnmD [Henriciella sp.]
MRLPPRPDLQWKDDGTPFDGGVGDVYYSIADGLSETRVVFLEGCGLPERWHGQGRFTIGELGFGTGLNFLAAWQMWRETRAPEGWLNFVSFEGFPLDAEDARRALMPWAELANLTEKLCDSWPVRAKGVQKMVWPDERLSLTLHIGDIAETLPRSSLKADAWFLDGFSPAKNEGMWSEAVWSLLAARCAPGCIAATFTVAGAVRRGLASVGLKPEKRPGYGRKRERLVAVQAGIEERPVRGAYTPRVAVLGAGIAGASAARALKDRGARVTLFDKANGPAIGASGNPLALVMPRLDAGDTPEARLLIDAYLAALRAYDGLPGAERVDIVHRPKDKAEAARFEKLLADPPLGLEHLEALAGGGVMHKQAMVLRPADLLPGLLEGVEVHWGAAPQVDLAARTVDGQAFDALVPASGWDMRRRLGFAGLTGRLGQIESFESEVEAPANALASGQYAITMGKTRVWGATYEAQPEAQEVAATPTEAARVKNGASLAALSPYWAGEAQRAESVSRTGIRTTTPDRLPLIGLLPDFERVVEAFSGLRTGRAVEADVPVVEGVYVLGGYGSRGFTFGPWGAEIVTADLFGDPSPAALDGLKAVAPEREILRGLKRRRF